MVVVEKKDGEVGERDKRQTLERHRFQINTSSPPYGIQLVFWYQFTRDELNDVKKT